uniref:Uncharacterized protein n=1 Tax=Romanomermis culicivorax TaxID=13658 RepID=A0A915IW57_ROMCU
MIICYQLLRGFLGSTGAVKPMANVMVFRKKNDELLEDQACWRIEITNFLSSLQSALKQSTGLV